MRILPPRKAPGVRNRIVAGMFHRLIAAFVLGAFAVLGASPATAVTTPKPASTPLKTITHIHSSPLCTGLRRSIGPAIGKVLDSDRFIAGSQPLFHDYVRAAATGQDKSAEDLAVSRLESLITPLVDNTEAVDKLLNDPYAFPHRARSEDDKKLLQMRAQLQSVNAEQKRALDLISGFVDTQQLGELQAAGNDMARAISGTEKPTPQPLAPTEPPSDLENAGITNADNDVARKYDPTYKGTSNLVGANPLNAFPNQIALYRSSIQVREDAAANSVIAAVPLCGGHLPAAATPAPSPSPSPAP